MNLHAAAVATGAQAIAERTGANFDVAHLAGLLHDVGKLVLPLAFGAGTVDRAAERHRAGRARILAEREVLGTDHAVAGGLVGGASQLDHPGRRGDRRPSRRRRRHLGPLARGRLRDHRRRDRRHGGALRPRPAAARVRARRAGPAARGPRGRDPRDERGPAPGRRPHRPHGRARAPGARRRPHRRAQPPALARNRSAARSTAASAAASCSATWTTSRPSTTSSATPPATRRSPRSPAGSRATAPPAGSAATSSPSGSPATPPLRRVRRPDPRRGRRRDRRRPDPRPPLGVSIGTVTVANADQSLTDLLSRADAALYEAQRRARRARGLRLLARSRVSPARGASAPGSRR